MVVVVECVEFGLFVVVDYLLVGLEWVSECDFFEWCLLCLNIYSEIGVVINDGLLFSGGCCWLVFNYLLLLEMVIYGFGWVELLCWLVSGYVNGWLKELLVFGWLCS